MKLLTSTLLFLFSFSTTFCQFGSEQLIAPIVIPGQLEPIDLNSNGTIDLVAVDGSIGWMKNENGTFPKYQLIIEGDDYNFIDWADLDQDGDLDIVSTNDDQIVWLEHLNGLGQFGSPKIITENATDARAVVAGDIDGDGDTDVLSCAYYGNHLSWYSNLDGAGNFGSENELPDDENGNKIAFLSDLDMDGDLDVLVAVTYSGYRISWQENLDGQGTFGNKEIIYESSSSDNRILKLFDIDGDGDEDILSASDTEDEISWFKNSLNVGSDFSENIIATNFNNPFAVSAGDFDGDNDLDIVATDDSFDERTVWFENLNGAGNFGSDQLIEQEEISYNALSTADIDTDGDIDIFSWAGLNNEKIIWYDNLDGQGNFTKEKTILSAPISDDSQVADVDSDGDLDITSGASWYENLDGDGSFSNIKLISKEGDQGQFIDLDGDSDVDLLTVDSITFSTYKKVVWFQNDGNQNFGNPIIITVGTTVIRELQAVDLDGDLDQDVIYTTTTNDKVWWCENTDGLGNFAVPVELIDAEVDVVPLLLKDVDADGFPDILTGYDWFNNIVWYKNMGGTGTFGAETPIAENLDFEHFDWVDFDFDGDHDLLVTGDDNQILFYENLDGLGTFSSQQVLIDNPPGSYVEVWGIDVDSDGDNDIVFASTFGDYYQWFKNEGFGNFSDALPLDLPWYSNVRSIIFPDINGDGDVEMVVKYYDKLSWYEGFSDNAKIIGNIYWDENENGIKDSAEIGLFQQGVSIQPNSIVSESSPQGDFFFALNGGTYDLTGIASPGWGYTGDSIFTIDVPNFLDTIYQDIGMKVIDSTNQISLDITSGPTRCGFDVPFWLSYQNDGATIMNGIIHLPLDTLTTFIQADPMPDSIILDTSGVTHLYWSFDDLYPTYLNQISLELNMPGVEYLGSFIEMTGDATVLNNLGDSLFTDTVGFVSQINCSYDPNDKLVEPNILNYDNYTLFGDTLLYTIRFQNTGTDTAINIRVEDQLDPLLDWTSFEVVASSHTYQVTLYEDGKLVFKFDDIYLPDLNVDEVGSHGFIKFTIVPKDDLDENTVLLNDAEIYFDFNPPILTNLVANTMVSEIPFPISFQDASCHSAIDGNIEITPIIPNLNYNWSSGHLGNVINDLTAGDYTVTITDVDGVVLTDTTITIGAPVALAATTSSTDASFGLSDGTATITPSGGTPPYSFGWNTSPVQFTATAINLPADSYSVVVTDSNGCVFITQVTVDQFVNVENINWEKSFKVSPNPSSGDISIQIDLPQSKNWTLNIHDILGQLVYSTDINAVSNQSSFDLLVQNLNNGLFNVSLTVDNQIFNHKIIVIKN